MTTMIQNLIAVLGILIIGALGYFLYTQEDLLVSTHVSTSSEASKEAAVFLSRLNELKEIKLDDSIFNDPKFRSLQTIRQEVEAVPVGRPNPFDISN